MKIDDLKSAICTYFNNSTKFSVPFIKVPTSKAAPNGNYVAVGVDNVEQYSGGLQPRAGADFRTFPYVASVYFVEVEGDGDILRSVLNEIQSPEFISAARTAGFTIWDPTSIMRVDTFDGEFYVRQWRFTCRMNFADAVATNLPSIATVQETFEITT